MTSMKTYNELIQLSTFLERYRYLQLRGRVGEDTFGFDRWLNQVFYRSPEWKAVRQEVLLRDNAFDLAHPEHPISGRLLVHHMNPITDKDIVNREDILMNPDYLITVSHQTHNAIHYGDESLLICDTISERKPNDTCPWKCSS